MGPLNPMSTVHFSFKPHFLSSHFSWVEFHSLTLMNSSSRYNNREQDLTTKHEESARRSCRLNWMEPLHNGAPCERRCAAVMEHSSWRALMKTAPQFIRAEPPIALRPLPPRVGPQQHNFPCRPTADGVFKETNEHWPYQVIDIPKWKNG